MQSDHSIITFQLTDSVLPQVQATSRYVFDFPSHLVFSEEHNKSTLV